MSVTHLVVAALLQTTAPQAQETQQLPNAGSMYDGNNAELRLPEEGNPAARASQRGGPRSPGGLDESDSRTTGGTVTQGRESTATTTKSQKSPPASGGGR